MENKIGVVLQIKIHINIFSILHTYGNMKIMAPTVLFGKFEWDTDKDLATVRFTRRKDRIRIIGAGFWRSGRKLYETQRKRS